MAELVCHIHIDEEEFKKIYEDEIDQIPKDRLQDVLLKAIEQHLTESSSWLINENPFNPNDSDLSSFGKKIFSGVTWDDEKDEISSKVSRIFVDNFKDILEKCIFSLVVENLFSPENRHDLIAEIETRWRSEWGAE